MKLKDLIIITLIAIVIYYLYTLNKSSTSILTKKEDGIENSDTLIRSENDIDIVIPTPYVNPYVNPYIDPYYDPYYYPYWDPYDLYPYGIIGVDAGADWNSTYNVVTRDYHKRRNIKDRRDRHDRHYTHDRRNVRTTRDRRNRR